MATNTLDKLRRASASGRLEAFSSPEDPVIRTRTTGVGESNRANVESITRKLRANVGGISADDVAAARAAEEDVYRELRQARADRDAQRAYESGQGWTAAHMQRQQEEEFEKARQKAEFNAWADYGRFLDYENRRGYWVNGVGMVSAADAERLRQEGREVTLASSPAYQDYVARGRALKASEASEPTRYVDGMGIVSPFDARKALDEGRITPEDYFGAYVDQARAKVHAAEDRIGAVKDERARQAGSTEDWLRKQGAAYTPAYRPDAYAEEHARREREAREMESASSDLFRAQRELDLTQKEAEAAAYEYRYGGADTPLPSNKFNNEGGWKWANDVTRLWGSMLGPVKDALLGQTRKKSKGENIAGRVYARLSGDQSVVFGGNDGGVTYAVVDLMTPEQQRTILNLAAQEKFGDVEKYFDAIKPSLSEENFRREASRIENAGKFGQLATGLLGATVAPMSYLQTAVDTATGKYTDVNSGGVGLTRLAALAREKSLENRGEAGKFLGQVGYSMADNLMSLALGKTGALIWLGLSAAGHTTTETLDKNGTQKQALAMGTLSGLTETATEKMSIDNLFDKVLKFGAEGPKAVLKSIATQTLSEGSEEAISEFAGALYDVAIMGEASEYKKRLKELREVMPEQEAKHQANLEFFIRNPAIAALGGAVSGALFGAGGVALSDARNQYYNRKFRDAVVREGSADLYIEEGLKLPQDSRGYALAKKLQAELSGRKGIDARTLGSLRMELDATALERVGEETGKRYEEQRIRAQEEAARRTAEELEQKERRTAEAQPAVPIEQDAPLPAQDPTAPAEIQQFAENDNSPAAMESAARQAEEAAASGMLPESSAPLAETSEVKRGQVKPAQVPRASTEERINIKKDLRAAMGKIVKGGSYDVDAMTDSIVRALDEFSDAASMNDFAEKSNRGASLLLDAVNKVADTYEMAYREASEKAPETKPRLDPYAQEIYNNLRGKRLYVPPEIRAEFPEYNEFRKSLFGVVTLTSDKSAQSIDTFYSELSGAFPGMFNEDLSSHPADQLAAIADFIKNRMNYAEPEFSSDTREVKSLAKSEASRLVADILNRYIAARPELGGHPAMNSFVDEASLPKVTASTSRAASKSVYEYGKKYTGREIMELTAKSAAQHGVDQVVTLEVSNLAGKLNSKVEFADLGARYNGYYNRETDTIFLNSRLGANDAIWTTLAHELTHRAEGTRGYKALSRFILRDAKLNARAYEFVITQMQEDYRSDGFMLSRADAEHEFMASYLSQNLLNNLDALKGVANTDIEAARTLLESIESVLNDTTENGVAADVAEARLVRAQQLLAASIDEVNSRSAEQVQEKYDYTKTFAEQIDDYKKGVFPEGDALIVGKTPEVFAKIGLNQLPMTYGIGHLREVLNANVRDHDFGEAILKQIPTAIKNPVAIFASNTHPTTSVVAILDLTHGDKPMFAAVRIDGAGKQNGMAIDTTEISTLHTRKNASNLLAAAIQQEQAGSTSVFYWDKEKATQFLRSAGVDFPGGISIKDGYVHSIRESSSSVKTKLQNVTQSQQFRRWFGDWMNHPDKASKVVNADGTPKVVYFGTNESFDAFNSTEPNGETLIFSDSKETAEKYGPNVFSAYLDIKNPLAINTEAEAKSFVESFEVQGQGDEAYDHFLRTEEFRETLQKLGHDGLIDNLHGRYAVLDKNQVKSATDNIGTFDGDVRDILYSLRRASGNNPFGGRYSTQETLSEYLPKSSQPDVAGFDVNELIRRGIEKYGTLKPGEQIYDADNPEFSTRKVSVPAATSDSTKTRLSARTLLEAGASQDPIRKGTMNAIDTAMQYKALTNDQAVKTAQDLLSKFSSLEAAMQSFSDYTEKVAKAGAKNMVAFGQQLLLEAQKTGNDAVCQRVLADYCALLTDIGQGVQAASIYKRLDSQGKLYRWNRVAAQISESQQNVKGRRETGEQKKRRRANTAATEAINRIADAINEMTELTEKLANHEVNEKDARARIGALDKQIKDARGKLIDVFDGQGDASRRIAEEIRNSDLRKLVERRAELESALNDRNAEKERLGELRREYDGIKRKISRAEEQTLLEIEKQKELLGQLESRRAELESALNDLNTTKEERQSLRREVQSVARQISRASDQYTKTIADIYTLTGLMEGHRSSLGELRQHTELLTSAKSVLSGFLRYVDGRNASVIIPSELQQELLDAKTREAIRAAEEKIAQSIADQMPGSWSEKAYAWRYVAMLANPTTHLRNIWANATQQIQRMHKNLYGAAIEGAVLRGEDKTKSLLNPLSADDRARLEFARQMWNTDETSDAVNGTSSPLDMITDKRKIFKTKLLNDISNLNAKALSIEDIWFKKFAFVDSFAQYMKANGLTAETMTEAQVNKARDWAVREALTSTYNEVDQVARAIKRLESTNTATKILVGATLPFKNTPLNIAKRGFEYSPGGLIKGLTYDLVQLHNGNMTANQVIDDISAGLSGTSVMLIGMLLRKLGILFSSPPEDEKEREQRLNQAMGQQNYSIRVGNGTYTIDWLSAPAMALFMGAELYDLLEGKGFRDSITRFGSSLANIANPIFEMSVLSGLTDIMRNYAENPAELAGGFALNTAYSYLGQFVPTVFAKIARAVDDTRRSTYAQKNDLIQKYTDRFIRQTLAKLPGASKLLPAVIDIYGNEVKNTGGNVTDNAVAGFLGRLAYNTLSPGYFKEVTAMPEDVELKRLYASTGDSGVLPKVTPKSVTYGGQTFNLDADQYEQYAKTLGRETYARIGKLYESRDYKSMSDEDKAIAVRHAIDDANRIAKLEYFEDIGLAETVYRNDIEEALYGMGGREKGDKVFSTAAEKLYDENLIELRDVYDAYDALSSYKAGTRVIDKLNALDKLNIGQDEKDFVYLTKIASSSAVEDAQSIIDSGASLHDAARVVQSMYDKESGETMRMDGKLDALSSAGLSNDALKAAYLALISDTDGVRAEMKAFETAGMSAKDYVAVKSAFTSEEKGSGTDSLYKLEALRKLKVRDKIAVISTLISSKKGLESSLRECEKLGFSQDQIVDAFTEYARINNKDTSASEKAVELSRWINRNHPSVAEGKRAFLKDVLSYWSQVKADAGKYDSLYEAGVSDRSAAAIYADLRALTPADGKSSVSDNQRIAAIAANKVASKDEKRLAILDIIGDSQSAAAAFAEADRAGIDYAVYAAFLSDTSAMSADRDASGKAINGTKKKKVVAYIDGLPLSSAQKDTLYLSCGYAKKDIRNTPWRR